MPWETTFDEAEALDRAMKLFWTKGFEATSMNDLVEAMGINKGSLYNTFGSKQKLFTRAVRQYKGANHEGAIAHLEKMDDPVKAVETLFNDLIAEAEQDAARDERKGCLLVNTALELPSHSDDLREMVSGALQDLERFFERSIRLGQERGEISTSIDPPQVATSLLSQVVGLRVLARGAFSPERLYAIRDQALAQIAP